MTLISEYESLIFCRRNVLVACELDQVTEGAGLAAELKDSMKKNTATVSQIIEDKTS